MADILKMKMSEDDTGEINIKQVNTPKEDMDIANKKYVDDFVISVFGELVSIKQVIVTELPEVGEVGTIYFILNGSSENGNMYDEYIYVNETASFEKLGSITLDLTDYILKTDATAEIVNATVNTLQRSY